MFKQVGWFKLCLDYVRVWKTIDNHRPSVLATQRIYKSYYVLIINNL